MLAEEALLHTVELASDPCPPARCRRELLVAPVPDGLAWSSRWRTSVCSRRRWRTRAIEDRALADDDYLHAHLVCTSSARRSDDIHALLALSDKDVRIGG